MPPKKYQSLTLSQKVEVIREVEAGEKKVDVSKKHNIPLSTLSGFLKDKDNILKNYADESVGEKRKRAIKLGFPLVDKALRIWFSEVRHRNINVDGTLIKAKALEFAKLFGENDFKASNGWFENWKERNNIVYKQLAGESASVDYETAAEWMSSLDPILEEYEAKNIFNVDETGIFYKCMPSKTYNFKGDKCFGGKNSKERVTVLVGANMDGSEKLPLLLIGKSARPHCFRHVKTTPIQYKSNKKAWMTSVLFEEWLLNLDSIFQKKNRKILLFIDNCPAHSKIPNLKSIKVIFFPPNMTSVVQPMDQGVIKNFKHYYRQKIVIKILNEMNSNLEIKIDILIASRLLKSAWDEVKPETIQNCFAKAGFQIIPEADVQITVYEETEEWREVATVPYIDYLNVDQDILTFEQRSDREIVAELLNKKECSEVDGSSEEEPSDKTVSIPSSAEALQMVEKLKIYSESRENTHDDIFQSVQVLESFVMSEIIKSRKQSKITSFFNKK